MGVFGKQIFGHKKVETLYDFAQHGILRMDEQYGMDAYIEIGTIQGAVNAGALQEIKKEKNGKKGEPKMAPTPKEIYKLQTLNKPEFSINCNQDYLEQEVETLENKLKLYPELPKKKRGRKSLDDQLVMAGGAVNYGRAEVFSMIERLNARRKYLAHRATFDDFAYTTNDALREVLAANNHLEARPVGPMLPDLPKEAVDAMHRYTKATEDVTGKRPVFYLISEKKEERKVQRKRDPILLAQSPFGFFWQILGAWDKEVVLLEEL